VTNFLWKVHSDFHYHNKPNFKPYIKVFIPSSSPKYDTIDSDQSKSGKSRRLFVPFNTTIKRNVANFDKWLILHYDNRNPLLSQTMVQEHTTTGIPDTTAIHLYISNEGTGHSSTFNCYHWLINNIHSIMQNTVSEVIRGKLWRDTWPMCLASRVLRTEFIFKH